MAGLILVRLPLAWDTPAMAASLVVPFVSVPWLITAAGSALLLHGALRRQNVWLARIAPPVGGLLLAGALSGLGAFPWQGQLQLTVYGLMMILGFSAAYGVCFLRAQRIGMSERQLIDIFLIAITTGLIGARARFVWENWPTYVRDDAGHRRPWSMVLTLAADFDSGGMVWYGGVILAGIFIFWYVRRARLSMLAVGDLLTPGALIGLSLGRIGCFFNHCCYGRPTTLPWGVTNMVPGHPDWKVHPTQLYESAATALLFASLWLVGRRRMRPGVVMALGAGGYGAWRFFNEGLRGDDFPGCWTTFFGLFPATTSQVDSLCLVLFAIGLGIYLLLVPQARNRTPGVQGQEPQGAGPVGDNLPADQSAP